MSGPALALMAAAMISVLVGLRQQRRARGTAVVATPGPRLPAAVVALARLPVPSAAVALAAQPDPARALAGAGIASKDAAEVVRRARAAGMLIGGVMGVAVAIVSLPLVVMAPLCVVGLRFLPDRLIAMAAGRRRLEIIRALPDLLDLIVICVAAGMALDPALRMAAARLGGPLGDEVAATLDMQALGSPRRDAYRALADRVGSDDVARLVAALLQAEELGTPLAHALAGQAESLRATRRQLARDRAARAAPRIQLVVALIMVPGALLLVLGVMVVELAGQIGTVVG